MKKFIIFCLIITVGIYLVVRYYKSGKFNVYLEQYPESDPAQGIEYYIGFLQKLAGKYDSALFRLNRVVNNYKTEKFKIVALYNIAECYEEKDMMIEAMRTYKKLSVNYPNTYYGELAKKRFSYLGATRTFIE